MIDPSKAAGQRGNACGPTICRNCSEKRLPVSGGQSAHPSKVAKCSPSDHGQVEVVYTPGHASHHVSYFDQSEGIAFVGDTTGRAHRGEFLRDACNSTTGY